MSTADQIDDYMTREFEQEHKTPLITPISSIASSENVSEVSSPRATTEKHIITIDMRNCEGAMKVYLGDVPIKPDVNMQMSSDTFEAFCDKRINGFTAVMTGKLSFTGSLGKVKKWDN